MEKSIVIGSRGSDLALWQAHFTQQKLREIGVESEIKIIKTQGDIIQHLSFDKMEGKGFFTKEIESALLSGEIDLAVHSHKDLETTSPPGLTTVAVSDRANPGELLLMHKMAWDAMRPLNLKHKAIVGTSAARRKGQLLSIRPDVEIKDLRGNVPTRIDKLRRGDYDAIVLARAGAERLQVDLSEFAVEELDPRVFIPAPAQGVLAFQVRENNEQVKQIVQQLNTPEVAEVIERERGVLRILQGGCQVPFGAFCRPDDDAHLQYWSFYAQRDGGHSRRTYLDIPASEFSAEKVLRQLTQPLGKSVLITRTMHPAGAPRKMLLYAGIDLIEKSFIEVIQEHPEKPEMTTYQWCFFTSPNAVKHFPFFNEIKNKIRFAAVGKGTLAALQERGIEVDFIGLGTPRDIGRVFYAELGKEKALVVCGKNGLRNVQKSLPASSFDEFEVYKTQLCPQPLDQSPDIIAFTSPSNVQAYFESNSIDKGTRVVSIGPSTEKALSEMGVECTVAWESSEQALADTIVGLC